MWLIRRMFHTCSCALLGVWVLASHAATLPFSDTEKAFVTLSAERSDYAVGATAEITATLSIAPAWHVNSHQPSFDYLIPTELRLVLPDGWPAPAIRYPPGEMKQLAFSGEPISVYDDETRISARVLTPSVITTRAARIGATLRYQACTDDRCLPPVTTSASLDLRLGAENPSAATATTGPGERSAAPAPRGELWLMFFFGLLGGLILNVMPCVLPVLSLKVLGLAKSAGDERRHVVSGALATSAGIVFSFWALALFALALRAAGMAVGWGIQFQAPVFVAALTIVMVLFCLNLWGIFEITLPAPLAGMAMAGPGSAMTGHFATGLFTTLMATPCTAPFLGTALGFALAQSPATIVTMFSAIGLGMALPYLALAAFPGALRWLPRPGRWMQTLRIVLGFGLAAAAVWLLHVLAAQLAPARVALIELALLGIALCVCLRQRARTGAGARVAMLGAVAASAGTLALAHVPQANPASALAAPIERRIDWQPFDPARAEQLASHGRLVFVDVTADWCITCKLNETFVLETEDVSRAFERFDVVAMRADWTNPNQRISKFLAAHRRSGIPFYLLYEGGGRTHLFSELLSKQEVIGTLERAASTRAP